MKLHQYSAVLCASIGVLVYLNSLDCGLCFDDERAVIQNNDIRPTVPWSNLLWNDFWGVPMVSGDSHKSYRPLCVATFRLNYLLAELEPMGYHLVNILLHGVVCYLYVHLVSLVCSQVWPALIAGLLFAVHPIHTEAVTGVVGRADVLAAMFYAASILVYYKAAQSKNSTGYQWLVLSLVLCTCSALSKETGITAIAVCLAMDYFLIQQLTVCDALRLLSLPKQLKSQHKGFLTRLFVLLSYVVGFMYIRLKLMKGGPSFGYQLNPAVYLPTPYRQLHWAYLTSYHCWLLLVPSPLSPEYAMHTIPLIRGLADPRNLVTLVTFIAVGLLVTLALYRRWGTVLFSLSLLVFPYVPASNLFFPVGFVVAERVLYLPSMGLCLLAGHGFWKLLKSSHKALKIILLIGLSLLLLVQASKTLLRNRDWKDEISLFSAAIKKFPCNAKMAHNLAVEYSKEPELKYRAIPLMQLAMSAEPLYLNAISDLGYLHQLEENFSQAEELYRQGIELVYKTLEGNRTISADVKNLKIFTRYSRLLRRLNKVSTAEGILRKIVRKIPRGTHYPTVFTEFADVLVEMNNTEEAVLYNDKALAQDPRHIHAHVVMAKMFMKQQGSERHAETFLRDAIEKLGYKGMLVYELASVLQAGHHDDEHKLKEAENLLKMLLEAQPTNVDALHRLGLVYYSLKQYSTAHAALLRAVERSPNHVAALYDLARLYVDAGDCDRADKRIKQLLNLDPDNHHASMLRDKCT